MRNPHSSWSPARTAFLALFVTLLKPFSNLFLAWGIRHFSAGVTPGPILYLAALLDPLVTVGVVMQIVWLLARMSLLSIADLSFVLPVTAVGYGISTVLGRVFLHEQVSPSRWMGAALITLGAALAAGTAGEQTPASAKHAAGGAL